jgi:hypothetical protein
MATRKRSALNSCDWITLIYALGVLCVYTYLLW